MGTRHVWVKGFGARMPAREGLVVGWRRRENQVSPPTWEALVVTVHDLDGSTKAEWIPAVYLVPVESVAPGSGNDEGAPPNP